MPIFFFFDWFRFLIYTNDHAPAHVHVIGPDWVVVADLLGPELRSFTGSVRDAKRAFRLVVEHRTALMAAWERLHG